MRFFIIGESALGRRGFPRDKDREHGDTRGGAGVCARTGAGSCTGAGPAGSSHVLPAVAAASAPPPTPSAGRSAPTVWSWAAGGKRNTSHEKGITNITGPVTVSILID